MADMTCKGARANFSDLLDNEPVALLPRIWARLHMAFCPACKPMLRSLEETKQALAALRDEPPPSS